MKHFLVLGGGFAGVKKGESLSAMMRYK